MRDPTFSCDFCGEKIALQPGQIPPTPSRCPDCAFGCPSGRWQEVTHPAISIYRVRNRVRATVCLSQRGTRLWKAEVNVYQNGAWNMYNTFFVLDFPKSNAKKWALELLNSPSLGAE